MMHALRWLGLRELAHEQERMAFANRNAQDKRLRARDSHWDAAARCHADNDRTQRAKVTSMQMDLDRFESNHPPSDGEKQHTVVNLKDLETCAVDPRADILEWAALVIMINRHSSSAVHRGCAGATDSLEARNRGFAHLERQSSPSTATRTFVGFPLTGKSGCSPPKHGFAISRAHSGCELRRSTPSEVPELKGTPPDLVRRTSWL